MKRRDAFLRILDASVKLQYNISLILEAKANETEKSRDWICGHINHKVFYSHEDQVKGPLEYHEQFLEVIDGLTKMEYALAKNLKVILNRSEDDNSSGMSGSDVGGFMN
ncbi:restriction endonuclease subunit S [Paenibacillus sp. HJGM_3]|uniref:restriction endonuclease subunit S n=1 Tax=Paenibacillus sp. HJGM_3 TaxID=3379816 RepID=UPI00385A89DE